MCSSCAVRCVEVEEYESKRYSFQVEHLALISKELGAELDDASSDNVEVSNLLGLVYLKKLTEPLIEPSSLFAGEV